MKSFLNVFCESLVAENRDSVKEILDLPLVQDSLKAIQKSDPDLFYMTLGYPLDRIIDGVLSNAIAENGRARFLFQESGFVENHFRKLIERYEGMPCCADKTRTIMRALARNLIHGDEIVFDFGQEYTFHLPKKIFKDQESILSFFEAIHNLFYGSFELYLKELQGILLTVQPHGK